MPRRCYDNLSEDDPPKKRNCNNSAVSSFDLKQGEFLKDITGKQWKLGKAVGVGGFGEIFLASDKLTKEVKTDCNYVAKVEHHTNGPLFVEMNCYLRIAKLPMIEQWKEEKNLSSLGMPHYVASGSHVCKGEKYRFLILPKFDKDLEKVLEEKKMLNLKTVLTISMQIIDVLEYIHSKGYIHSDIKASNILLSNKKSYKKMSTLVQPSEKQAVTNRVRTCRLQRQTRTARNLRPQTYINYREDLLDFEKMVDKDCIDTEDLNKMKIECNKDQVYLLDYGLACKFLTSNGEHKPFCADERKAHAGTILFCSRDAHKGVPSRRSDLESLGYNMIYWLTGNLPWCSDIDEPEIVAKKKQKAMTDIEYFLRCCFTEYPRFLEDYFKYLQNLKFQEKPDYNYCKKLFRQTLKAVGFKDDSRFDFDNLQCGKLKVKKRVSENIKIRKVIHIISRPPLQSNIPVKPSLRKKVKDKNRKNKTKWFEDLTDPEEILKQAREKKNMENNDTGFVSNIADLDIRGLNPTDAMMEVYNKCMERMDASPSYKGDGIMENVDGYTPAMINILHKMKKRKELEYAEAAVNLNKTSLKIKRNATNRKKKNESPVKALLQKRSSKSATVLKKEASQGRKVKSSVLRRTYSLRG